MKREITPEQRAKKSAAIRFALRDPEYRKRVSERMMGDKNPMKRQEVRDKKSQSSKGKVAWNKDRKEYREEVLQRQSSSHIGHKQTEETMVKRGIYKKDENATHWLGDNVGNDGLHQWVRRKKGKASTHFCDCGEVAAHWANIENRYKRVLEDFKAMCVKCHARYDRHENPYSKYNT